MSAAVTAAVARWAAAEAAGTGAPELLAEDFLAADLLGRPPRRFVDWARAHAAEFA